MDYVIQVKGTGVTPLVGRFSPFECWYLLKIFENDALYFCFENNPEMFRMGCGISCNLTYF